MDSSSNERQGNQSGLKERERGAQHGRPKQPAAETKKRDVYMQTESSWGVFLTGWLHVQMSAHKVVVVLKQELCVAGAPGRMLHDRVIHVKT